MYFYPVAAYRDPTRVGGEKPLSKQHCVDFV